MSPRDNNLLAPSPRPVFTGYAVGSVVAVEWPEGKGRHPAIVLEMRDGAVLLFVGSTKGQRKGRRHSVGPGDLEFEAMRVLRETTFFYGDAVVPVLPEAITEWSIYLNGRKQCAGVAPPTLLDELRDLFEDQIERGWDKPPIQRSGGPPKGK